MATLYDISWSFTVCHCLQLPLNAMGHKRRSSSPFTEKKRQRSPVQFIQLQKGFCMLKCIIVTGFIDSDVTFGSINSAYLEGWVISTAHPDVLISQFESAMQQRCAPRWDRGAPGAQSQVGWSRLQFSHSDVVSAVH